MDISRRNLLKGIGAASASIILSPMSAIAIDDDLYSNSRLGISLIKPNSWGFVSATDFNRVLDEQEEHLLYPELQRQVREVSGDPILKIYKYPDDIDGFLPSISLLVDPIGPSDETFESLCEQAQWVGEEYYEEYKIERQMSFGGIDDHTYGEFSFVCAFETDRRYQVRIHTLMIRNQRAEFTLACSGLVSGIDDTTREYLRVKETLKLW